MTATIPLGTFAKVLVRDAWPTEDGNFTPWLATPEGIKLLGEVLNMDLEVEDVERTVGPFRADILAKANDDDEEDHRVIIENQFGKTDHSHLGQLLTYLAGIDGAKTLVWIAETIQSDHRAAIDWLNTNTTEDFSFFAIEIELWRIGESPPAPRFNVIASPNDWKRRINIQSNTRRAERQSVQLEYWTKFADYLTKNDASFTTSSPNRGHRQGFAIGRRFRIVGTISISQKRIGVELFKRADPSKVEIDRLFSQKDEIEKEFGEPLDWKRNRVALFKYNVIHPTKTNLPSYMRGCWKRWSSLKRYSPTAFDCCR